ncbi:ABC transporter permease [Microbacterium binotii]|uniref:ABC transporter permease n=1 Tax=Microbacterium binotii TaxID=462710 RepID=UPI001F2E4F18|nr:ABC transporter permease [Microbacterium binotii]UIN29553.1 ABC transporter permease [Microbacterium binotii]
MRTTDLITSAISNTFRSKTRTVLTILAIFVGAFTLTVTSGLGTGINRYIDDTVASIGASDVMSVTKSSTSGSGLSSGPTEYDPDAISASTAGPGATVTALTDEDITVLRAITGVEDVSANKSIDAEYLQHAGGKKWVVSVGSLIPGQALQLAEGSVPDDAAADSQVTVPDSLVDALGFADAADAVGASVIVAVADSARTQYTVEATITGVTEETLVGTGSSITPNAALSDELFTLQNTGVPIDQQDRYASASVRFAANASSEQIDDLKQALTDAGYTGTTVADQLGTFKTVIDAIVLVLNAFAVIALLAASFGIVNTLLMSVQERTREIGLMKAMGMGSGRVFTLFSIEAAFIGLLGSAIGAGIGMIAGTAISGALSRGLFADLAGLQLIAFDPLSIVTIIFVVMVIAFLAGTLPAARAARADPVTSLRYE